MPQCSTKLCYLVAPGVRSLRVPVLRYPHVVTGLRHISARSYECLFPGGPQPAACLLRSGTVPDCVFCIATAHAISSPYITDCSGLCIVSYTESTCLGWVKCIVLMSLASKYYVS
jgi:hypothetical protein